MVWDNNINTLCRKGGIMANSSSDDKQKKKTTYRKITITDATGKVYVARLNINESIQHNRPTSSQLTINSKYPYHIHNGVPFYYSGQCAATFVDNTDEEEDDKDECEEESVSTSDYTNEEGKVADFNYEFAEWLHNGLVKYLNYSENKTLHVGILETVEITTEQDSTIDDQYNSKVVFNWEQIEDS